MSLSHIPDPERVCWDCKYGPERSYKSEAYCKCQWDFVGPIPKCIVVESIHGSDDADLCDCFEAKEKS